MRIDVRFLAICFAFLPLPALPAHACDPCALYSTTERDDLDSGSFALFVYEEFTSYERRSQDEASVRDGERTENYSHTQLGISYGLASNIGIQLSVPLIVREYEKYTAFRREERENTDLGDAVLSAHYTALERNGPEGAFRLVTYAGAKFPTGDTGSLGLLASEDETDAESLGRHHTAGSGLGGDALNFGTGSFDFPFGVSAFARRGRGYLSGFAQYTLRTEGSFDYQFGNDLVFETSPGYFVWLEDDHSVDVRLIFSGEQKADDERDGETRRDTDLTHLFLGPGVRYSGVSGISAGLSLELPVYRDQKTGVLPEYRIQASIARRF